MRISPKERQSRHVVICISGFLTQDVEKSESWRHVINHFKNSEIFAYNWTSLKVDSFFESGHYETKKSKGRFWNPWRTFRKQFLWALEQAKLAGISLAIFLMREDFSKDRAISFIGHSLGTVIIMHCLNTLYHFYKCGKLHAGRIINDVFLWAGAAVLNPTGKLAETVQRATFCGMANGRINNCFSLKDFVLKYGFMNMISKYEPVGLVPIFEEMPTDIQDVKSPCKRAYNYDVTEEAPGHSEYHEAASVILERVYESY